MLTIAFLSLLTERRIVFFAPCRGIVRVCSPSEDNRGELGCCHHPSLEELMSKKIHDPIPEGIMLQVGTLNSDDPDNATIYKDGNVGWLSEKLEEAEAQEKARNVEDMVVLMVP